MQGLKDKIKYLQSIDEDTTEAEKILIDHLSELQKAKSDLIEDLKGLDLKKTDYSLLKKLVKLYIPKLGASPKKADCISALTKLQEKLS